MLENMPEISNRGQRIVLEHTQGPHKGLMQIKGLVSDLGLPAGEAPPPLTDEFTIEPGTRQGQASLVRVSPRAFYYREITAPAGLGTFDRRQR